MRLSKREATLKDLFRELQFIGHSRGRSGSHDDTGAEGKVGGEFVIRPMEHIYSYTSVQSNEYECSAVEDDWRKLLAYWREWAKKPSSARGYNGSTRKTNTAAQQIPPKMRTAVILRGNYHYGSSVRARCSLEIWVAARGCEYPWQDQLAPSNEFVVFHLEHVGEAWSTISALADIDPIHLCWLAEMDAFKKYKK